MSEYHSEGDHIVKCEKIFESVLHTNMLRIAENGFEYTLTKGQDGIERLECSLKLKDTDRKIEFTEDVDPQSGPVYALYKGLHRELFSTLFPSVSNLFLVDLDVKSSGSQTRTVANDIGFSSKARVRIVLKNSKGSIFTWEEEGYNSIAVLFSLVLKSLFFFANSELAFRSALLSYLVGGEKDNNLYSNVNPTLVLNGDYNKIAEEVRAQANTIKENRDGPARQIGIATSSLKI